MLESIYYKNVDYAVTHSGRLISAKGNEDRATKDEWNDTTILWFDTTTGKPATEKDAEEFIMLVQGGN